MRYKVLQKIDMATFKAEVYAHQKKSDGTYNIKKSYAQQAEKVSCYYILCDERRSDPYAETEKPKIHRPHRSAYKEIP